MHKFLQVANGLGGELIKPSKGKLGKHGLKKFIEGYITKIVGIGFGV